MKPILLCSLLLAASAARAENSVPAAVTVAAPVTPAPAAPRPPKTLAGIDRHVTRTITALMQRLAQSRIPAQPRSRLNERLLAVQAQSSAAVRAGQPPAGEDLEGFAARLGKDLDAIAGAMDSASRRAP